MIDRFADFGRIVDLTWNPDQDAKNGEKWAAITFYSELSVNKVLKEKDLHLATEFVSASPGRKRKQ